MSATKQYAVNDVTKLAQYVASHGIYHDDHSDNPTGYRCGMCNGFVGTNPYLGGDENATRSSFKHDDQCLVLVAQDLLT